ncbi:MAG: hypothetical protein IT249_02735 [Chitinophagaceae bacterium]|nr:hypothetical protein [Chitinophagaceae bacterium]
MSIPTFIINLKFRTDRKVDIANEFEGRSEFDTFIIEAYEHEIGSIGLWKTIQKVINIAVEKKLDYILLCEDDHQFTDDYSSQKLFAAIAEAKEKEADILCGGVSWFQNGFQVSDNFFTTGKFSGMQFTIVFKKFYNKIPGAAFTEFDSADYIISGKDQYWSEHSVAVPLQLAKLFPGLVHIEPEASFFYPSYSEEDLKMLFEESLVFPDAYCFHLWESLSYDKYLSRLNKSTIKTQKNSYNNLVRRFL